jgi:tetratricopeptide (TPR) repeat protein/S1-C subfamily serine protease
MILTIQIVRDNISLPISGSGVMSMRAMAYRLRLMTTICSLCLFSVPTVVLSPQVLSAQKVVLSTGQASAELIKVLAKAFTVKVFAGQQRGSGVILAKNGQRYTVVTNAHVIDRGKPYRIQTPDGKTYKAVLKSKGDTFKGNDLAVLEFSAAVNYQVAQWGDSGAIKGAEPLFAAGFPEGENQLSVSTGQVSLIAEKALIGGYRIGFSNDTQQGMSGGSLLNAQGKVIGILGQGNQAILERAYTYQDGSKPNEKVLQQMRESSFAVPIVTVRQMVAPATIAQKPSTPQAKPPQARPAKPSYTGVLGAVDKIAEQITVRIKGKKSGSGVIVAKQGNTYSVLTAKHVVEDPDTYRLITADGKEYAINPTTIRYRKENSGVDLAVVQFSSSNSYRIATLATASLKDNTRVFVSGFPSNPLPQRVLTTGRSVLKERKEIDAKESYSLALGVGLLYTCLSIKGMSGGPVLDSQGRVVAINTGAEDYNFGSTGQEISDGIDLGYSLGVPIDTFTGISGQFAVQAQQLTVERTQPKEISEAEHQRIRAQLRTMKAPGQGGTAMDWLNYGNQLYRLEDYDEAIAAAKRVIQLKPDFYYAYYLKGLTLYESGKFTEALIAFGEATRIPNFYPAWKWKSVILSNFRKYDEALLAIKKAIEVAGGCNIRTAEDAGGCVTLYLEQGHVLNEIKRYQEAIDSYSRAIALNSDFAAAYNNRGNTYDALKQYDKALTDYNKAIALNSDDTMAYYNRGVTYSALKQYDKALADYNKAIALNPDFAMAYPNRGVTYSALKQYDKALTDFNKAITLNPDYARAYSNRGATYSALKQYDKALTDYNKAIALNSDDTMAYYNRGVTYSALKQYDKALTDYNKAIALNSEDAIAYPNRGVTYYFLKQYDKALTDYNKAIALNPDFAMAYYNRGLTYSALKQYDKALTDYNKAIALNSDYAMAYQNRGATYLDLQQYDKAMQDFQKAYLLAQQQSNSEVAQLAQRGIELLQSNK